MNLFEMSNQSFNVSFFLYVFGFVFYAGQLIFPYRWLQQGATWFMRLAWIGHTFALGVRWAEAGLGHPPWSNLYESLVFFSWGVISIHLFLEWRLGLKFTGVFASAVVVCALGIASLHPNKEIEPLVPALQSYWILIHVFMACIAYAFFLISSFTSILYLLKNRLQIEIIAAVGAAVCFLFLAIAVGKDFFLTSQLNFFKVVTMPTAEGVLKEFILNFKDNEGRVMQKFVTLPYAQYLVWPLLSSYLASGFCFAMSLKKRKLKTAAKIFGGGALFFHFALIGAIICGALFVDGMALKSNPYRLAAIVMTFGMAAFLFFLFWKKQQFIEQLPTETILDRWSYQTILFGVPFMTLNLITGAIWAYFAWGRYWGWDPKEVWALITWFIYLIYLHMRILGGWKGRKTAYISIAGFFIVIFTYLGVNLVISGLHSYATS